MIQFSNVSKSFRKTCVLDDISLDIGLSERVALIGSNGAGKTTLIRCLLGEYTFDGRVTIDGRDPRRERTAVLGSIGFVPQLPPPLKMPVAQLIDFSAALCGTDPARIHELAQRLGLDLAPILTRPFVKLSGGMKQKLLIAIALGRHARLLIMDEPAANLDPEARKIFFDLLAERLNDATMIISSHRLDVVSALGNRVIEMDMGKVVLDDQVADAVSMTATLTCRVVLKRSEPAFAKALDGWNISSSDDSLTWTGSIAAPTACAFSASFPATPRFGRRKLAPAISPGKSWEGAYGAVAGVVIYGLVCLSYFLPHGLAIGQLVFAAAGLVAFTAISIIGDLFESMLKRQAGVKDSGTLLPGHGGVLDRIDSLTSTLPLAGLLALWFAR